MNRLPIYKTEGIIIKSADLGELDRLLVIYTASYGKILARAISARKRESKLRGYLEPFTYSNFLLAKSKTIDILTDIEPINNFSLLRGNLESLAYAYYFSELIDKLVVAPERDEKVWALLKRAMEVLNRNSKSPLTPPKGGELPPPFREGGGGFIPLLKIKSLFEQKLLEFLGHGLPPHQSGAGGVPKNKKPLEVIQGLAGEEIKTEKFLHVLSFRP